MSVLLALDSSTESMALALSAPAGRWLHETEGGPKASETLLPVLRELLDQAGLSLDQVDAIGFGRGPGAFTGLRTACAVAQGLAFGLGKPVLALDSLMLVAEDARQQSGEQLNECWVVMDARMGEIYAAAYRHEGQGWRVLSAPALYSPASLHALWAQSPPSALCGSALAVFEGLSPDPDLPVWPRTRSRAAALATLAASAWAQGLGEAPEQAMPLYVRDKVAQTTEERRAARTSP